MARQGQGPGRPRKGCQAVDRSPPYIGVWPNCATNWGLRSPNSSTNNAYNINTDGTVNNNNVYNPNFAARPALMEYRVRVPARGKQRPIIKGGHIPSSAATW